MQIRNEVSTIRLIEGPLYETGHSPDCEVQ
jgi:hypothetical protein